MACKKICIPDEYEREAWTSKFWEGNIVYWEPITFVTDRQGNVPKLQLMYKPEKILDVRMHVGFEPVYEGRDYAFDKKTNTFSLKDTIELTKGRDYTVNEDGTINLLYTKSKLHYTDWEYLHPKYKEGVEHDWLQMPTDPDRWFNIWNTIATSRIYVTYTHKDTWGNSYIPKDDSSNLPRLMKMLKNKEEVNFTIFGDSIATGADGTGPCEDVIEVKSVQPIRFENHCKPYTPSWAEMTVQTLKSKYGYDKINKINKASGSSESNWGMIHADELVNPVKPDVVTIAFGMNECGGPTDIYKGRIAKIMDTIHEKNPECEFILMSSMEPNPELGKNNLSDYEKAHYELQKERKDLHIAVCPVNSFFWSVINRGKLFTDISSTNFNHPNDFLIRMYAQTLIATLGM